MGGLSTEKHVGRLSSKKKGIAVNRLRTVVFSYLCPRKYWIVVKDQYSFREMLEGLKG